ncbi:MAG: redoxin domain-containing protein [Candidatus Obscuribacterales bacterium]|nr:redoxin domain-containing protein [Steroidobacteraceae bacterium]
MQQLRWIFLALLALSASANALTKKPGDRVDNFRLLDQQGMSHELYYLSDMKAVVLMAHDTSCKASRESVAQLSQLRDQYKARGVEVLMLDSSLNDTRDLIIEDAKKLNSSIPVLLDPLQLIGESLNANRAGEVLVVNPKDWTLAYRGPVKHAADALDATLAGASVKKASVRSKGCKVSMPERNRERAHAKISYEKTIAPMLVDNCVACHRQGGIGPWQMTSYDLVRGFAPMIREVVRTERMPPWHADPHFGTFSNNRSLSDDEVKALVHWIEAGAPRGKGTDPLTELKKSWPEWTMGEPDLVLEVPPFAVPATGSIPYQTPVIKNPLGRDIWMKAIDFSPSNRSVVHHILGFASSAGANGLLQQLTASRSSLGVYVPGDVPHALPQDTGVFIPKDSDYVFQIHYTSNGKATTEVTRIGIYFAKEPPKFPLRSTVLLDPRLKIPAQTKAHVATATRTFQRDALIYSLMPHAHMRGKAAQYTAHYPNGKEEVLLSVPKYDFNWQTTYEFATPKLLPKGTRLVYTTTYDNSPQNKANPDPSIEVRWGEQTWQEMIYGDVRFRYLDETAEVETPKAKVSSTQ